MRIGLGVMSWDREERQTNRYGSVHLGADAYPDQVVCPHFEIDLGVLRQLEGKRVKLWAIVRETRDSGHCGDLFLGIKPSRPETGEEHVLGVGILRVGKGWDGAPTAILEPLDGRLELWLDPRVLYRLHDQTVELFGEETDEPGTTVQPFAEAEEPGVLSTGETQDEGHVFQVKGVMPERVFPPFERIGEGLFMVVNRPKRGKRWNSS